MDICEVCGDEIEEGGVRPWRGDVFSYHEMWYFPREYQWDKSYCDWCQAVIPIVPHDGQQYDIEWHISREKGGRASGRLYIPVGIWETDMGMSYSRFREIVHEEISRIFPVAWNMLRWKEAVYYEEDKWI